MGTVLTQFTVDGVALWVVLLICGGVFLGSFMDAIAGGGGIITVPTYLMGLSDFPIYNALGTNKLSSGIGTVFSTVRFIRQGYVDWALFAPAIVLALGGSVCGTWLQHHTPAVVLKYLLLLVLPVVAFITLRTRKWPDEPEPLDPRLRRLIVWAAAFVILAEVGRHPVQNHGNALTVEMVHEPHEVLRRTETGGGGKIPRALIAPGIVQRVLRHRQ